MHNKIDWSMIGKRFGRLTIIDLDHEGKNGPFWLCRCDCGNEKVVGNYHLKCGDTTSCGCKKRERKTDDLTGKHFGRLTVIQFDHMDKYSSQYWLCECNCPSRTRLIVSRSALISGHTKSCGCFKKDLQRELKTIHGEYNSRLHNIWGNMKQRCTNKKDDNYNHYGNRGIEVFDEWMNSYENFRDWALSNGYSDVLTIDRINNDYGYFPENCRWVDHHAQMNNTRCNRHVTYNNETHTAAEWAKILNLSPNQMYYRLNKNDMRDFEKYFYDKEGANHK